NMLQKMGHTRFTELEDGMLAWKEIQNAFEKDDPYDFVISDWKMSGMSGLELLKNLRSDERFQKLPFLMATAEAEQANVVIAVKAGVSNFIVKPFALATFQEKMKKIFP